MKSNLTYFLVAIVLSASLGSCAKLANSASNVAKREGKKKLQSLVVEPIEKWVAKQPIEDRVVGAVQDGSSYIGQQIAQQELDRQIEKHDLTTDRLQRDLRAMKYAWLQRELQAKNPNNLNTKSVNRDFAKPNFAVTLPTQHQRWVPK